MKTIDLLAINQTNLFHDGSVIFQSPLGAGIAVVGFWEPKEKKELPGTLYIGTSDCCHGHVFQLDRNGTSSRLRQIVSLDTNAMDLIDVRVDWEKANFPNEDASLIVGYGCAGASVRLVGTYYPKLVDVVSTKEFHKMIPSGAHTRPVFRANAEKGTIHLDLRRAGYRVKAGQKRDPHMPECVVGSESEFFVSEDLYDSVNLTERLGAAGVKLGETVEALKRFRRLHA